MNDVDTLRRAAALIREAAEAATPGPWTCYGDHLVWPSDQGPAANDPILAMVGEAHDDSAKHIASWHPAVALAVADWLDHAAARAASKLQLGGNTGAVWSHEKDALAVARAYLGEPTA